MVFLCFLGSAWLLNETCIAASTMQAVDKVMSAQENIFQELGIFSIYACYVFDEMPTTNTVGKENRTTHV